MVTRKKVFHAFVAGVVALILTAISLVFEMPLIEKNTGYTIQMPLFAFILTFFAYLVPSHEKDHAQSAVRLGIMVGIVSFLFALM